MLIRVHPLYYKCTPSVSSKGYYIGVGPAIIRVYDYSECVTWEHFVSLIDLQCVHSMVQPVFMVPVERLQSRCHTPLHYWCHVTHQPLGARSHETTQCCLWHDTANIVIIWHSCHFHTLFAL